MRRIISCGLMLVGVLVLSPEAGSRSASAPVYCRDTYHEFKPTAIRIALPDVQQPDEFSCGAAALMSILAYYGAGPEDYDVLKKELGSNQKSGTDYRRMVRFAAGLRLSAEVKLNMTIDQLEGCLDEGKPVICSIQAYAEHIPWSQRAEVYKKDDNGHYLVVIGYDDENIYFMDPGLTGRRGFLPKSEFIERWHDNEGTAEDPKLIGHLGLVIWKAGSPSVYARFARRVD
jgi:predicted double-glycine peptidase